MIAVWANFLEDRERGRREEGVGIFNIGSGYMNGDYLDKPSEGLLRRCV